MVAPPNFGVAGVVNAGNEEIYGISSVLSFTSNLIFAFS